jgi:hypothetical protein
MKTSSLAVGIVPVIAFAFVSFASAADASDPANDARIAALEQRLAALERQVREVREESTALRNAKSTNSASQNALRRGVTPAEAVESFRRAPKEPVTVELGVQSIGYPDGPIPIGEDPEPAISATWDNYFVDGGTFTAIVPPAVYRKLTLPGKDGSRTPLTLGAERREVVKHIEENGIRVTGVIVEDGGHFRIVVDSADDVVLYIKGSGM